MRHAVSCRGTRPLPPFRLLFLVPFCHSGITECSSGPGHDLIWQMPIVVRNGPCVVFNLSFCVCGVLMCTGTSFAFCFSGESPLAFNHSSKYALCKVSPVGIQNTYSRSLLWRISFFWVLVWHHYHHVLASFLTRQSRLAVFFFLVVSLYRW